MPTTVTLTCAFETAMTGRLRPALARFWRDRLDVTWVDGPADVTIVLDDRLPDGHAPGSEGYVITQDAGRYTIVGEGLGLAFGVGRLAREALRGPDGPVFPALTADEAPAVPVRGIYFPLHRTGGDQPIAFNAYSALLYDEGRYDDFEAMLVELIFWGMNTIGLWYCEWMPLPGEGAEGRHPLQRRGA